MSNNEILTEKSGHVGIVRLNRPKQLNALNLALMEQLAAAMEAFDEDDEIYVIVLAGSERAVSGCGPFLLERINPSRTTSTTKSRLAVMSSHSV